MGMKRSILLVLSIGVLGATGCTGAVMDNQPGQDTWLDPDFQTQHAVGALAVEKDESHVWLVHGGTKNYGQWNEEHRAFLSAIDPATGHATDVLDVSQGTDRRMVFTGPGSAVMMTGFGSAERLDVVDTDGLTIGNEKLIPAVYAGTRTSPSGRFLVVADQSAYDTPINVIDTTTLDRAVVHHGGDLVEAMWNHAGDRLLAIAVDDPFGASPTAHLLRWNAAGASVAAWPSPELDVTLHGYQWDTLFSYTWIGISPDDHWAVFPLIDAASGDHVLVVLDQTDGTTRVVPGSGPVGFTPDGSTIVSYGYDAQDKTVLYMIDVATLSTEFVPVPGPSVIDYFVTWDGSFVVMSSIWDDGRIVLFDPQSGTTTQLQAGGSLGLREFVTRPGHHQLWMASDDDDLYRLDLDQASLTRLTLGFGVKHLNILPSADRLVLGPPDGGTIRFFDLASQQVDMTVALPDPWTGVPAAPPAPGPVSEHPVRALTKLLF
jgi:hypothetical protein